MHQAWRQSSSDTALKEDEQMEPRPIESYIFPSVSRTVLLRMCGCVCHLPLQTCVPYLHIHGSLVCTKSCGRIIQITGLIHKTSMLERWCFIHFLDNFHWTVVSKFCCDYPLTNDYCFIVSAILNMNDLLLLYLSANQRDARRLGCELVLGYSVHQVFDRKGEYSR